MIQSPRVQIVKMLNPTMYMKKPLAVMLLLAGAVGAYAQGVIELSDYVGVFTIDVFSPQTSNPGVQMTGNTVLDNPSGTVGIGALPTPYQGVPLGGGSMGTGPTAYGNGNLWTLALYAAPRVNNRAGLAAAETAGLPVMTSLFQTSGGVGGGSNPNSGINGNDSAGVWADNFDSDAQTVLPGFTGGATLQLEVWYNGGVPSPGNFGAQEAASPVSGLSAIESIAALGLTGAPPTPPPTLRSFVSGDGEITSFSLVIPEPSTIVLGLFGASALLFRYRK